jgi:Met-10+ like-protein
MPQALIEGLTLSGATEVHEQYLDAVCQGHQDPFMAELFARSVPEGGTVIDGGAYLGFYSLLAARRVGSDGTVFAFEPDPDAFEVLCHNVRENGFEDRVVPLALGVGVRGSTLDEALGARPVDLVKLHIEGGEVEGVRGMRRTLAASSDPHLIVECDPEALSRAGTSPRTLLRELGAAGLDVSAIDDERWLLHAIDATTVAGSGHLNLYCRRA